MNRLLKPGAFTLIELLIVVAIIAILAAIAVPNFIEAQTRSKVSRAKSDFRSIATAMEAYFVDYNTYPHAEPGPRDDLIYVRGLKLLTSPVAYITTIPIDPFGNTVSGSGTIRSAKYEMGSGKAGINGNDAGWPAGRTWSDFVSFRNSGKIADTYQIESDGPDNKDTITDSGNYPKWGMNDVARRLGEIYDPTNGTKSRGEIVRVGGTKPPGPALDAFWSAALK